MATYKKLEYDGNKVQVQSAIEDGSGNSIENTYAKNTDVKNSTITITQGGVTKGSFTLNQGLDQTIALDGGGGVAGINTNQAAVSTPYYLVGSSTSSNVIDSTLYKSPLIYLQDGKLYINGIKVTTDDEVISTINANY